ncbi:SseB protein N-terminal domain-containing protein [Actinomadura mexicana]|uniref:SseB protein N-terminal domain-containing protein n=1 Tax=Actinomadura mexicana TaxID=134959 RepID=A0A238UTY7_9ACTN|nr:SseB protein N-terminal domain-containing protein [Actinomadura mexicana]
MADAWRPTSELEHRLQETVRAGDQESYFRLLADADLVVPVPPDLVDGVLAGEAQPSWPTQEEDGRVHVLVYTSAAAMRACLGPSHQHFLTVRFGDIAESWPDDRWWLAVDAPARGVPAALPIEARLPAWFVRQVADGDGRPPQVGRASPPWEELRDQHRDLPREAPRPEFQPANDVERELLRAAANNDHDLFLQTLAATDVLLPVPDDTDFSLRPGRPGFPWQTREVDGSTVVPVFTSPERLAEASGPGTEHIALPFTVVLRYWPDHDWLLAINSGSPAGGTVLAQQLPGLAIWADQRAAQRMTDRFEPQNDIEQRLFDAARRRDTETFFKILLGAQVLVPVDAETPWGIVPGDPEFPWRPVPVHGRTSIQLFTSLRWMNDAIGSSRFIMPSLLEMVTAWPDASWTLVLNPGTPIDASMPGEQVRTLSGPPAPPSAATPPPPAAPSVPVAPAVPADPAAPGPGRHAGAPPAHEPTVPAPAESGRHHAGTPGGAAQPGLPDAVPPAPAHFGEAAAPRPAPPHPAVPDPAVEAGDVPVGQAPAPVPGVPGGHLADPSSTAIDPGHMAGPEPAATPGTTNPPGGLADPLSAAPEVPGDPERNLADAPGNPVSASPPGMAPQGPEPLGAAPGAVGRPYTGAPSPSGIEEPGLPEPAPQGTGPLDLAPGMPHDAGHHMGGPGSAPGTTSLPGGVEEPGLPEPIPQAGEPLGAAPVVPGDAGHHLANAPGTPPSTSAPGIAPQGPEPLDTAPDMPDDASRLPLGAPGATAPGATTPSGGMPEPGLPRTEAQGPETPDTGPGAPDDAGRHLADAPPSVSPPGPAPQGTEPLGTAPGAPDDASRHLADAPGTPPSASAPGIAPQVTEPLGAAPGAPDDAGAPGVPSSPASPGPAAQGIESLGAAPGGRDDAGRAPGVPSGAGADPGHVAGRDGTVPGLPEGADRRVAGPAGVGPQGSEPPGATSGAPGEAEVHHAGVPTTPHGAPDSEAAPRGLAAVPQDAAHPGQPERRDIADATGGGDDGGSGAPTGEAGAGRALRAVGEPEPVFEPGNRIDQELYEAASGGDSDAFLRVLLNANVLVPIPDDAPLEVTPVQREFQWDAALRDAVSVQVFTSMVRLREVLPESRFVYADFRELIGAWPREDWAMVLNPGTHIGASLHGDQVQSLSEWAVRVGLVPARPEVPLPPPRREPVPQLPSDPEDRVSSPAIMQKVVPHSHVSWYLEQGYDRVGGFVHSTNDVAELQTPAQIYEALGLLFSDSSFSPDDEGVYVIRWPAYCPDLYLVPFGGRDEEEMTSWGESGWVIERPPFTGNGFAPGSAGSIREYKVTSVRLPYGAEMYYIGRDRSERFIAMYDPDRLAWLRPDAGAEAWDGRTEAAQ